MTEPTESIQQLKARIQRQLLEQIASLSKREPPIGLAGIAAPVASQDTVSLLINAIHAYSNFMAIPTVTFGVEGGE